MSSQNPPCLLRIPPPPYTTRVTPLPETLRQDLSGPLRMSCWSRRIAHRYRSRKHRRSRLFCKNLALEDTLTPISKRPRSSPPVPFLGSTPQPVTPPYHRLASAADHIEGKPGPPPSPVVWPMVDGVGKTGDRTRGATFSNQKLLPREQMASSNKGYLELRKYVRGGRSSSPMVPTPAFPRADSSAPRRLASASAVEPGNGMGRGFSYPAISSREGLATPTFSSSPEHVFLLPRRFGSRRSRVASSIDTLDRCHRNAWTTRDPLRVRCHDEGGGREERRMEERNEGRMEGRGAAGLTASGQHCTGAATVMSSTSSLGTTMQNNK